MVADEAVALPVRVALTERSVVVWNTRDPQSDILAPRRLLVWTSKQRHPHRLALRPAAEQRQHYKKVAPVHGLNNKEHR